MTGLAASTYFLYEDNKELSAELSSETQRANQLEEDIKSVRDAMSRISAEYEQNRNTYRRMERYNKAMQGREATVVAKPKLVEKLIQKAVDKREKQFECVTGGLCEESQQ